MSNDKVLVEYSDGLRQAVNSVLAGQVTRVSDSQRRAGRSTLTDWRGGGSAGSEYTGPFSFTFNSESGKLIVGAGFLNRNGDFIEIPETQITPKEGYICCQSKLKDSGDGKRKEWETPAIVVLDKPSALAYPLGRCVKQEDNSNGETLPQEPQWLFECYEVEMAFIIATRQCPLASGGGK